MQENKNNIKNVKRGKILYVIGSLNMGGAERHVVTMALALQKRGWQPSLFVLSPEGPLLQPLNNAGIAVKGWNIPSWLPDILGSRPSGWLQSLLFMTRVAIELLRHPGTVAHFFLPATYILGGLAAWLVKSHPRIMSRRSLNYYQNKYPKYRKIECFLHSRMDIILGNSLAVVKELQGEVQGDTPIKLIYNGIETAPIPTDSRSRIRAEMGVDDTAFVIIIVANLIPYKGHKDLLNALNQIKDSLPNPWHLLCIGRDDGTGESLHDLAKNMGIADNLILSGPRINIYDYLAAADIAVSASHEEGFSNSVLEAMMMGLPMVVTDVGGNGEAVLDGVTGHVVPSHDPTALGQGILKLALDENRQKLGMAGRTRVIEHFSLKACVDAYEAVYFDAKSK